jgi:L-gulonolactone oxidase
MMGRHPEGRPATIENFGHTVSFRPAVVFTPDGIPDLLATLNRWRDRRIRCLGGLHSWSPVAATDDVVLDLRRFDAIELVVGIDDRVSVKVGAGCTVDDVLDYLAHGGYTLPTYGIIGKQTVAGAISTATHGSGAASLSNFVRSATVAAFDAATGEARVHEWHDGLPLRAVRCAVGCAGVVVSVTFAVEDDYLIDETTAWFDAIDGVLQMNDTYPLQQFFLIPWTWQWLARLRRRAPSGVTESRNARRERMVRLLFVDVGFNGLVRLLAGTLRWWAVIRWLYRRWFQVLAPAGKQVVDRSRALLMMRNDLFRHTEIELFVPAIHVASAALFVEWVLRRCGGEQPELPSPLRQAAFGIDPEAAVRPLHGRYVHDFPITFRRVAHDDTLISMTSGEGGDVWYAISLVTYQSDLTAFHEMATLLARAMASAYRARPHWGKVFPLTHHEIAALYPNLPLFRAECTRVDPRQVFVNDFARDVLGFSSGQAMETM